MDVLRKLVDGERALRTWLWISLVCNMGIIVTGAVVRLTGSGLGCPTWPRCTDESYVPHEAYGIHGVIEFGNRLLTFVLVAAALGAFIAAWRNRGRGSTLWWITLGVGLGIPLQAIVGGITVLTSLDPSWVAPHLLLSIVLIVVCVWALRVGYGTAPTPVAPGARWLVIATFAASMTSIVVGTVVTGAGPHAGDAAAPRNGADIESVARLHSLSAWLVVALVVACVWLFSRTGQRRPARAARLTLITVALQGVIGYAQYFLGLPVGIVILHMVGLTVLTAAVSWLLVSTTRSARAHQPGPDHRPSLHAS
ncbi:COX15/CtaA family protein [Tessaracoccus sp. Z1128]